MTRKDQPVSSTYIQTITGIGASHRHTFKWANAASFLVPDSLLQQIKHLHFVQEVLPVRTTELPMPVSGIPKKVQPDADSYGLSSTYASQISLKNAHAHIDTAFQQPPGSGIMIAIFDTGFRLTHRCFEHLLARDAIVADSDFVDLDADVTHEDTHGSQTLALIGGYDPGVFMGVAHNATFVLARTEEVAYERHLEEDNWVAALVWAESLGVDIVNSSLGYRYDFDSPDSDYVYMDMDGISTTISRTAAEYATSRGVVIVNSVGNEGNRPGHEGTINAPSDADGVIAVGALDVSGQIAAFSSRGPTYDGRIKPDVVALGVGVPVPAPQTTAGYVASSGTSFAAPIVSGICALLRQTHPSASPALIRAYLTASCRFVPSQQSVDNTYGYGLPNAEIGVKMKETSLHVHIRDSSGSPVPGVILRTPSGLHVDTSEQSGEMLFSSTDGALPDSMDIGIPALDYWYRFETRTTPWGTTLTLRPNQVDILIFYKEQDSIAPIEGARVFWRKLGQSSWQTRTTSARGVVSLYYDDSGPYEAYASASGFIRTEPQTFSISTVQESIQIEMRPQSTDRLIVFPSLIPHGKPGIEVIYEFTHSESPGDKSFPAVASVRNMGGELVWKESKVLDEFGLVKGFWRIGRNQSAWPVPGTYVFLLSHGGKTFTQKILILGSTN